MTLARASRRATDCDVAVPFAIRRRVMPSAPDALDRLAYVREHGIDQFVEMWRRSQTLTRDDDLLWGDEVEYAILRVTDEQAKISLRGPEIRDALSIKEEAHSYRTEGCAWHPEYGRWMVEGTPSRPYGGYAADLLRVERNMRLRRRRLQPRPTR